jgi:hypothetical protein
MKETAMIVLLAIGALMMGYTTFSATGQSRQQPGFWDIRTSAANAAVAWKINTQTGEAFYCVALQQKCLRMD